MIGFAKEKEFDLLTINAIDGVEGEENIFLHRNTEAEHYIDNIMPEVLHKAKECGLMLNFWLPHAQESSNEQKVSACTRDDHKGQGPKIACHIPWEHLFVDPGGGVRPHCLCKTEVGNILRDSLGNIWNNDLMQRYRHELRDNVKTGLCNRRCVTGVVSDEELTKDD